MKENEPQQEESKSAPKGWITANEVKMEIFKASLGLLATIVGIVVALNINSTVETRKDNNAYDNVRKIILAEAKNNRGLADSFFVRGAKDSTKIHCDLDVSMAETAMKDLRFINYTKDEHLSLIQNYIKHATILNSYKNDINTLRFTEWSEFFLWRTEIELTALGHEIISGKDLTDLHKSIHRLKEYRDTNIQRREKWLSKAILDTRDSLDKTITAMEKVF